MGDASDRSCYENIPQMLTLLYTSYGYKESAESALGILYTLIGMAAVFGNACALYYFLTIDKKSRFTASRIFYTAFAATDLMMGIVSCWTGLVFGKNRPFYLCSILATSKPVNIIIGILNNFSMFSGPNIIALMAVSRCVGVFLPFKFKHIFTPVTSCVLVGIVLIHPLIAALLPFFVPNLESNPHDYSFEMISGQIVYNLYEITREVQLDTPIAHRMNIGFVTFPRLLAIVVMVVSSVAVAVKLLLYRAPVQMQSNAAKKNTHRSTSITLLILAAVFFISYAPFCFVILMDVTDSYDALGITIPIIFYLAPSSYLIAYVSSAVNPMVYQLRGRSIFENKTNERKGTVYVNHVSRQETRMSVVDESKL
ncbi:uncharacterized protein LOC134816591 [Bolinopsis microptera]|uniref:uncharacterized protein LOC134816591 n=1 Tax=Bolinopsis microptera TaxID=2820187 RepID=UPI0030797630